MADGNALFICTSMVVENQQYLLSYLLGLTCLCAVNTKGKIRISFFCSKEYISSDPPRVVLDKMEKIGYKVIASTGVGQTIIWTLYKPK